MNISVIESASSMAPILDTADGWRADADHR